MLLQADGRVSKGATPALSTRPTGAGVTVGVTALK
ncbi:hypothetical protein I41_09840 [Lacipirellula limnantheis]|uniref:Uncharacterized protein n=1 Tax=Lacipirellula limnantheis TaxID=2528024 RepID=A0A517TTX4_9BACT|nr:hypothetical protein I41_09840 [Lacipirellula limnantheis]